MIEIKMVCEHCSYDFGGVEMEIDHLDDNECAFHYCYNGLDENGKEIFIESDERTSKNKAFKEEINKYILKSFGHLREV